MGGWETFGLEQAFNALIDPAFLPPDAQNAPVGVEDPDETVSSVGFPEGSNRDSPAISKCSQLSTGTSKFEKFEIKSQAKVLTLI